MPNYTQNVSFQAPTDYATEQADIERKRKLADALQAKGLSPGSPTQMVGGWAVPQSPMEGIGKMAQALMGGYQQKQLTEQQKELVGKQQQEMRDWAMQDPSLNTGPANDNPNTILAQNDTGTQNDGITLKSQPESAQSLSGRRLAWALQGAQMQNPIAQQMGIGAMQQEMQQQKIARLLGGAGMGGSSGGGTQGGGNMPSMQQLQALMLSGDPTLAAYARTMIEAQKGIAQRPGAPVVNPYTGAIIAQPTPTMQPGIQLNVGNGTPTASPVPGYSASQDALGLSPLQQVTNEDQTTSFIPKSQLIQGAQPSAQPPQSPQASPQSPVNPGFAPDVRADVGASQAGAPQRIATGALLAGRDGNDLNVRSPAQPKSGPPRFGQTQEQQINQQRQTAAGKAVDETFAKDYVAFTQGGAQDATKQLAQLQDVVTSLGNDSTLTGPLRGRTPDLVRSFTNPNAIAMRERVEEVVQRSLRAILGAQFTEKEGERLISRAYNPSLSTAENKIRVERLFTQLKQALAAKQDAAAYFQKNNTLQGWQGKMPSMSDFDLSGGAGATASWGGPERRAGGDMSSGIDAELARRGVK